jgi:hypothetical protein
MTRLCFVFLSLFVFCAAGNAENVRPNGGLSVKYSCKTGFFKEKIVQFANVKDSEVMFRENIKEGDRRSKSGKSGGVEGTYLDWGYLIGVPHIYRDIDIMHRPVFGKSAIKNGNLAELTSLKAGEYTGTLSFDENRGGYESAVVVTVGKGKAIKTAIGTVVVIPFNTTIQNWGGEKGAVYRTSSLYSPAYRILMELERHEEGRKSDSDSDCQVSSVKNDVDEMNSLKSLKVELPNVGTKITYQCTGIYSTAAMEVNAVDKNMATVKWSTKLGDVTSVGPIWMVPFGFGDSKSGGPVANRKFKYDLGKTDQFSSGILPGIFFGKTESLLEGPGKELSKEVFTTLLSVIYIGKRNIPKYGVQPILRMSSLLINKTIVREYVADYSPSLKMPVAIINNQLINKNKKVGDKEDLSKFSDCKILSVQNKKD